MKKTNESGITLIALVVTIVVLLILAGVTIAYVLSDNSVFDTANDAAKLTKQNVVLEYVGNAQTDAMMLHYSGQTMPEAVAQLEKHCPDTYTITADTPDEAKIENGRFAATTYTVKVTDTEIYTLTFSAKGVASIAPKTNP